jgi:phosphoribosylaminoimidazole-succinocarboxamide synthase
VQAAERAPLKLVYEGSVKRVFASESASPDKLWFEFTDDYSVFDWGKMPDTIADKGRALTVMGAWFFETLTPAIFWKSLASAPALRKLVADKSVAELLEGSVYRQLCTSGLPTHFFQLTDLAGNSLALADAVRSADRVCMEVKKATVLRPQPGIVLGQTIYGYPQVPADAVTRLIPLEVVFRFGMPSGSSLKERLQKNPEYAQQLGLGEVPNEGSWFSRPVLEFYTKLEPKDRLLSLTEALAISTLDVDQFKALTDLAQLCALGLFNVFAERGIELWDGKFEFILDNGQIRLADSIGPDELRLIYKGLHLSKEIIRQVYRDGKWEKSLKQAQKLAVQRQSHEWKSICRDELKSVPEPLPPKFKAAVDAMYPTLVNHLAGKQLFADQPDLDGLVSQLNAAKS